MKGTRLSLLVVVARIIAVAEFLSDSNSDASDELRDIVDVLLDCLKQIKK